MDSEISSKNSQNLQGYRAITMIGRDPLSVFVEVQTQFPDAFFWQSSEAIDQPPDTTVIGLGPFEVLRDLGGKTQRVHQQKSEVIELPFLSVLATQLRELQVTGNVACRFQNGGIFGCIGYECVAEIEPRLKEFGYFRNNEGSVHSALAEVMIARQLIVFDHQTKMIHLIVATSAQINGEIDATRVLDSLQRLVEGAKTLLENPPSHLSELDSHRLSPLLGFDEFKKRVLTIKERIHEGDIFQAVLAEKFTCQTLAKPIDIFKSLRETSPAPYSFYFGLSSGVFLGASPETLVKVNERRLKTNPIAGTRPRGETPQNDQFQETQLLQSEKEAAEHLMLVDLARNDLGRVARPGSVKVSAFRQVRRFSNVMHLVSEVEATLADPLTALDTLKACFPAGTLSGAPKVRAMEILAELEPSPRKYYGGAVVAFDSLGGMDSCIAIRCLEVQSQTLVFRAGAGIVADSKAKNEYKEILNKTKLLRVAIGTAEQSLNQQYTNHVPGVSG